MQGREEGESERGLANDAAAAWLDAIVGIGTIWMGMGGGGAFLACRLVELRGFWW